MILDFNDCYYYNRGTKEHMLIYKQRDYLQYYISNNYDLIIKDNFILDKKQLKQLFYYECCKECNNGLGCCDGVPYCNENDFINISQHKDEIFDFIDNKCRMNEELRNKEDILSEDKKWINKFFDATKNSDRCYMHLDNGCALKQYCFENNINYLDLCCFSCVLFPLDIICIGKYFFITSYINNDILWSNVGRWDNFNEEMNCNCFHGKTKGIEVYKFNKNLLIHEFGLEKYTLIDKLLGG